MRAFVCAAGLVLMGLVPARGEDQTALRALVTANDTKGWEAVGRLDIGPAGFCTGALIAPDIVLTAAHCLYDPESHERVIDGEIQFLAGFRNGRATAYRGVRRSVVHPDYVYTGPQGAEHVADDLALLALDRPIRNSSVEPFDTGHRPLKGDELKVVSYAHDRATRPSLQDSCHVLGRPAGILVTSCDIDFGSSGAPVFAMVEGIPRIVSVISAKAEIGGRPVSLGTGLDTMLPELEARLGDDAQRTVVSAPAVRRPTPTAGAARVGAKFLRP